MYKAASVAPQRDKQLANNSDLRRNRAETQRRPLISSWISANPSIGARHFPESRALLNEQTTSLIGSGPVVGQIARARRAIGVIN